MAERSQVSPARAAAFDILLRVETEEAYASELIHGDAVDALSSPDRGLATELVMGVLRWRSRLDAALAPLSWQPLRKVDAEVLTALRMAAYQIGFLDRIPARAAVNESVELVKRARKRSAVPYANAVLRKLKPEMLRTAAPPAGATVNALAAHSAHPPWLVERWLKFFGAELTRSILEHDQRIPETTIRMADPTVEAELLAAGVQLAPGALLRSARRVVSGDVTSTAAYAQGRVFIQDECSQLVALLVGRGRRLLDCCAAPGGKTASLAARNATSEVVAAELHPHRARLLRGRMEAAGLGNVEVLTADATELPLPQDFDRVLADVPCSGTGTLARNPEIKWKLKPEDLADLHARQAAILRAVVRHLVTGGRLVYSTCSLEPEEGEQVVEEVLAAERDIHVVPARAVLQELAAEGELAITDLERLTRGDFVRTVPGVVPGDGFFAAVLERRASAE